MKLLSKVTKIDSKIIIPLAWSKSVKLTKAKNLSNVFKILHKGFNKNYFLFHSLWKENHECFARVTDAFKPQKFNYLNSYWNDWTSVY
jgi:hypothetical protein